MCVLDVYLKFETFQLITQCFVNWYIFHPPPLKATDICNVFTATRAKNKNSAPQTKRKTTRSRYKHKETTKDIRQFVIVTKRRKNTKTRQQIPTINAPTEHFSNQDKLPDSPGKVQTRLDVFFTYQASSHSFTNYFLYLYSVSFCDKFPSSLVFIVSCIQWLHSFNVA